MTTPRLYARVALMSGVLVMLVWLPLNRAHAAGDEDAARSYNAKATAAFALSRYAEAAEFYEKAFEARQDPALLYNAAQAHRLAGNRERALSLYQNYLRIYANGSERAKAQLRVQELKVAIEHDRIARAPTAATPASPGEPAPATTTDPVVPLDTGARAPAPLPSAASLPGAVPLTAPSPLAATTIEAAPATPAAESPATGHSRPWIWVAVGGGVVAVAAVILLLTLSGPRDPSPSFGNAKGN